MSSAEPVRWGVLGVANIAVHKVIPAMLASDAISVEAIASRSSEKAADAARSLGIPRAYGSYEDLLADERIEAVYIPLPNHLHHPWTIAAAEAGKHVLCEKPLALTAPEAHEMIEACDAAGVELMEAFMYRLHPMTAKLVELVRSKAAGELRMIRSSFGFNFAFDPKHRLLANDTAGGAILDLGCYPVSMARLLAGAAAGEPFLDPTRVSGLAHFCETGADDWASVALAFPGGVIADAAISIGVVGRWMGWRSRIAPMTRTTTAMPARKTPFNSAPMISAR